MFDKTFSHYLSYGAADQHTVRELRGSYDGLLVPGTVAAFQREGTGGFVLALSASDAQTPYAIDPRSPLFQQEIAEPKRAHEALKAILGLPPGYKPSASVFDAALVETVAKHWASFNSDYRSHASAKFEKYAKRLGDLKQQAASGPTIILAPYFVAQSRADPWWDVSSRLYSATRSELAKLPEARACTRVVATDSVGGLSALLPTLRDESGLIVWVSGLDEFKTDAPALATYGRAIKKGAESGQRLFALYGGFFAVLLGGVRLSKKKHGIGYGEHRNWIELPQSGPPPARYYLPELHKYVRAELADVLWGAQITRCACPACGGNPPILLDYHDLMMHSVHCRAREIQEWSGLSPLDSRKRLEHELGEFAERLGKAKIQEEPFKRETRGHMVHLSTWIDALSQLSL